LSQVGDDWIQEFDVVVATELAYDDLVRINRATRKVGKAFYAGGLFGLSGYVFADLVKHTFQM
jgi:ubiquitin-like 1-activating enzyme E1 A